MTMAKDAIRIDDLGTPVYTEMQQGARDALAQMSVDLSVEAVLAEASKQSGLDDFGPDDFIERLAVQLQSVEEDDNINNLGRYTIFAEKVLNAVSRARVFDLLKREPAIDEVAIEKPVIIAGLPRSGTTHLVNMIAADTRFRSMPYWESRAPVALSKESGTRDANDPRFQACAEAWAAQDAMLPLLKNMHAMNPEHIHEEIELQDINFSSYTLEWIANVPRWRDYYLAQDQTEHYAFLKRMLQLLTWQQGPNRWILKSPQHLEQLLPLYNTFPDATIAITHRDPVSVITSAVTMIAYGARMRCHEMRMAELAEYWIARVEQLLRACVRDIDKLPSSQTVDVLFPEFMADDMAMVKRVYGIADIEVTTEAEQQLSDYLSANPRGKHGQIIYDLEGDFGVNREQLYSRFDFYYERYPSLDPRR